MRDLNLGPESKKLIERWRKADSPAVEIGHELVAMLERWIEVAWCWPDACPSQICGGPHVKVRYEFDKTTEVIEPANRVGETFPDAKHTIIA